MHRTLKRETTRPPRTHLLQQQEAFDAFVEEFNGIRPHEALDMKQPAQLYTPSTRPCPERLPDIDYSLYDDVVTVGRNGGLRVGVRQRVHLADALAGQPVGIREEQDGRWLIAFMRLQLGYVERDGAFTPAGTRSRTVD